MKIDAAKALEVPPARVGFDWVIVVLGPADQPLRGVCASTRKDDGTKPTGSITNENGELTLTCDTASAELPIAISSGVPYTWQTLTEPRTVVRFPDLLPLSVRLIDGVTGLSLDGGGVRATSLIEGNESLERKRDTFVLPISEYAAGKSGSQSLSIDPPTGYAHTGSVSEYVDVSPSARSVHLDVPVWPEMSVDVRVLDATGNPVAGASVGAARITGIGAFGREQRTDAEGRVTIGRVAYVPGERAQVEASVSDRYGSGKSAVLRSSGDRPVVEIRLPAGPRKRPRCGGVCGSGCGSVQLRYGHPPEGGTLTARIRVLRRDGTPAIRVTVRLISDARPGDHDGTTEDEESPPGDSWAIETSTDADGIATLAGLHPDERATVQVFGRGFVSTELSVKIDSGLANEFMVVEANGGSLDLRVVDSEGRAVAAACIEVECWDFSIAGRVVDYVRLVGSTQHATLLTDADGRLRLERLSPGEQRITVKLGSRKAKIEVDQDDLAAGATITLK